VGGVVAVGGVVVAAGGVVTGEVGLGTEVDGAVTGLDRMNAVATAPAVAVGAVGLAVASGCTQPV